LKEEVVADKEFIPVTDKGPDALVWNSYLKDCIIEKKGSTPRWCSDPWLYVECYMYRRIMEAIYLR
jgi:hypothetical protein